MTLEKKLPYVLLILRASIFLVMIMWALDKILNPNHATKIFEDFYFSRPIEPISMKMIGGIQVLFVVGFLLGYKKKITYAAVLLMHTISTFSSFGNYLNPFDSPNLLFFAAWPMLAACITLFVLREYDTITI